MAIEREGKIAIEEGEGEGERKEIVAVLTAYNDC